MSANGTIGYPNDFNDFPPEVFDYSYTNVSCSNGYSSCTGSQLSNCSASGGLLSIQCSFSEFILSCKCNYCFYTIVVPPECYYIQTGLNNYFNKSNGPDLYTLTGRPTICVDGSFLPICSDVPLSPIDVSRICLYSLGISSKTNCIVFYFYFLVFRRICRSTSRCNGSSS